MNTVFSMTVYTNVSLKVPSMSCCQAGSKAYDCAVRDWGKLCAGTPRYNAHVLTSTEWVYRDTSSTPNVHESKVHGITINALDLLRLTPIIYITLSSIFRVLSRILRL